VGNCSSCGRLSNRKHSMCNYFSDYLWLRFNKYDDDISISHRDNNLSCWTCVRFCAAVHRANMITLFKANRLFLRFCCCHQKQLCCQQSTTKAIYTTPQVTIHQQNVECHSRNNEYCFQATYKPLLRDIVCYTG
jgi:hypothetical protein